MTEINLKIEGMSCQHCVLSVKKALDEVDGVRSSEVSIGSARVEFNDSGGTRDEIKAAIRKAGYSVVD